MPPSAALGYKAAQPVAPFELDTMPGTGDIWSTSSDVTQFVAALHQGELVSPTSLRAMSTAQTAIEDHDEGDPRLTTTGYGYGMYTGIFGRHPALYHSGDNPGYKSFACWLPDQAASIVILLNDEAADITSLLRRMLALTWESEAPTDQPPILDPPAVGSDEQIDRKGQGRTVTDCDGGA